MRQGQRHRIRQIVQIDQTAPVGDSPQRQRNPFIDRTHETEKIGLDAATINERGPEHNELHATAFGNLAQALLRFPLRMGIDADGRRLIAFPIRVFASLAHDLDAAHEDEAAHTCGRTALGQAHRAIDIRPPAGFGIARRRTRHVRPCRQMDDGLRHLPQGRLPCRIAIHLANGQLTQFVRPRRPAHGAHERMTALREHATYAATDKAVGTGDENLQLPSSACMIDEGQHDTDVRRKMVNYA